MALRVWLPLNGNINNYGISDVTVTNNGATVDNSGKIGQCYRFGNGSASSNGINLNNNFVSIGKECSISVWVNPTGNHYHYNGTIISSGDWNHTCWAFGLSQDNSQVDLLGAGYNKYVNCPIPINTWTHLVCTRKNGVATLYKNGIQIATSSSYRDLASDASNTYIGRETYANGYFTFNGKLNDVRIYDHCLSPKEVKELAKELVLHYKLTGPGGMNMISNFDTSFNTTAVGVTTLFENQMNNGTQEILSSFAGKNKVLHLHSNGGSNRMYRYYAVTSGKSYTVSFDYYSISTHNTALHCELNGGNYSWLGSNCAYSTPGVWKRLSTTYTNITSNATLYIFIMCNTNSDCYVKNIKLEEGTVATPWCSNSADVLYSTLGYNNNIEDDCSGYCRNGTKTGAIIWDSDTPRYTTSYKFNGSSCIKNNQFYFNSNIWTISLWYKYNTAPTAYEGIICLSKNDGSDSNKKIAIMPNSNYIWFKAESNSITMSSLKVGEWCHLALVSNGTSATIYENGIQKGTTTISSTVTGAYDLVVGARASSAGAATTSVYNKGNISDIRMYATALSEADIKELYNTPLSIDNIGNMYTYEFKEIE